MLHPTITAPNTPRIKHVMNISLKTDFTMRLAVCIYVLLSSPDGLQFICIIIFKLPKDSVPLVTIQILSSALHLRQSSPLIPI